MGNLKTVIKLVNRMSHSLNSHLVHHSGAGLHPDFFMTLSMKEEGIEIKALNMKITDCIFTSASITGLDFVCTRAFSNSIRDSKYLTKLECQVGSCAQSISILVGLFCITKASP